MAADSGARHRPGAFKQQNKSHKTGRHRSKGQINKETKGRVNAKVLSKHVKGASSRQDRRNHASQLRKQKREEALAKHRARGGHDTPPLTVAVIPLAEDLDTSVALTLIQTCDENASVQINDLGICHISVPRFRQRFAFLTADPHNLYGMLDAAKVADVVVFLLSPKEGIDQTGELYLTCLFGQGIPTSVLCIQGFRSVPQKKQGDVKTRIQKHVDKWFPKDKCHPLDTREDALLILRTAGNQKLCSIGVREHRPHLLAEQMNFELDDEQSNVGTLKVCGFVRSKPLSVNGLVHIPGWGDFQMSQIDAPKDPYPLVQAKPRGGKHQMTEMEDAVQTLEKADTTRQESLQRENDIDPMEGEQTWPTEEELAEAEEAHWEKKKVKQVPKGTSDYQAAWILDSGGDKEEEEGDESTDDDDMQMEVAEAEQSSQCTEDDDEEDEEAGDEQEEMESVTVTWGDDVKYDAEIDQDEEHKMLEKYKEARQHQMFPDEIDTPMDLPARTRFARFRGLKSFRTSPWDPKENLPQDYARIYQFENFKKTRQRVLSEDKDSGAMPGWYICVHIVGVPREFMESYQTTSPVVIYGLLPHEQKMSVLNLLVKRHVDNTIPIKSKDRLIFHVGYRRFAACPIFSQHTNGDKHKFERFLNPGMTAVATLYAPIMFSPASVLVFRERHDGQHDLIASGSLLSVNPDRIVTKRLVLSGHPFKINKRMAVVRYMFFNRDDILWFKPIELRTKCGRRGHIKEPLGTHGHMKCVFDGPLSSMDTVLMNLYKRMYPKWTYDPVVKTPATGDKIAMEEDQAVYSQLFD